MKLHSSTEFAASWHLTRDDQRNSGEQMHALMRELFPICRSITGAGQRRTLGILRQYIDLKVHEVPSGSAAFDWTVPREWNIRDAYIKDPHGRKIVDFQSCNLHVVSYSAPLHTRLTLGELKQHLHSLPEHPEWIPYRTCYYKEDWGFCLSHRQLEALPEGVYEVCIDSSFSDGSLTYGECLLPGASSEEILVSCHICHPSLANDNLSGIAVATFLARHIAYRPQRYSYRFLFTPGCIGSIVWLAANEAQLSRIHGGLILACLGDAGGFTYKRSRRGDTEVDRAVSVVLKQSGASYELQDFVPYGYDERQFCSPGLNLAMGCLMRTPHARFPEYHTSADDLNFVRPEQLADSLACCAEVMAVLEKNRTYMNLNPKCEPQLGKRGLYGAIGGGRDGKERELAMLWVLNMSDGKHTLLDIAERADLKFDVIEQAADTLLKHDLLGEAAERRL